jgi:hypothetical protein
VSGTGDAGVPVNTNNGIWFMPEGSAFAELGTGGYWFVPGSGFDGGRYFLPSSAEDIDVMSPLTIFSGVSSRSRACLYRLCARLYVSFVS